MTQEVPLVILNLVHVGHDQLVGRTCFLDQQVGPSMIRVHFAELKTEWHGLKTPPFCQDYAPSSQHSYQNYPWWGKLEWKLRCLGFQLRGSGRCQQILLWQSELLPFQELGKTNNFLMSLFPTVITKEIFGRNVALTCFVGKIAIIVARRQDGCNRLHCFSP